jgi:hypothetical protein
MVTLVACGGDGASPAGTMRAFMQAAAAQDAESAFAQFVAEETSKSEVEKLISDPVLYQGFQDLKVDRWVVFSPPQSDRGRLLGSIVYSSGHTGKYEADMLQTSRGWRLTQVTITVSSERIVYFGLQESTPTPPK